MSCPSMQESIALDAGGDLDGAEKQRLDRHLASCSACRDLAADMRRSRQAVRALAEVPVGSELLASVRTAVLEEIETTRRPAVVLGFPLPAPAVRRRWLAAATVLLAAAAGWWLAGRDRMSTPPEIVRHDVPTSPPIESPPAETPPAETPFTEPALEERQIAEIAEPRTATIDPIPPQTRRTPPATLETARSASEPMVVKWLVDDPDLVIYWLIEADQPTEENPDEPKEA